MAIAAALLARYRLIRTTRVFRNICSHEVRHASFSGDAGHDTPPATAHDGHTHRPAREARKSILPTTAECRRFGRMAFHYFPLHFTRWLKRDDCICWEAHSICKSPPCPHAEDDCFRYHAVMAGLRLSRILGALMLASHYLIRWVFLDEFRSLLMY